MKIKYSDVPFEFALKHRAQAERGALLRYDVNDLQEALDRVTRKNTPKGRRKTSEYAHPFSCEGLGQWD